MLVHAVLAHLCILQCHYYVRSAYEHKFDLIHENKIFICRTVGYQLKDDFMYNYVHTPLIWNIKHKVKFMGSVYQSPSCFYDRRLPYLRHNKTTYISWLIKSSLSRVWWAVKAVQYPCAVCLILLLPFYTAKRGTAVFGNWRGMLWLLSPLHIAVIILPMLTFRMLPACSKDAWILRDERSDC